VAGLQNAGLQRGDCVLIHSFNDIYYPIIVLGIIAAGGIYAGTNPSYTVSSPRCPSHPTPISDPSSPTNCPTTSKRQKSNFSSPSRKSSHLSSQRPRKTQSRYPRYGSFTRFLHSPAPPATPAIRHCYSTVKETGCASMTPRLVQTHAPCAYSLRALRASQKPRRQAT
jgi:hypothetical protein